MLASSRFNAPTSLMDCTSRLPVYLTDLLLSEGTVISMWTYLWGNVKKSSAFLSCLTIPLSLITIFDRLNFIQTATEIPLQNTTYCFTFMNEVFLRVESVIFEKRAVHSDIQCKTYIVISFHSKERTCPSIASPKPSEVPKSCRATQGRKVEV